MRRTGSTREIRREHNDCMPPKIPAMTDAERWVLATTLRERYEHDIGYELAEVEARLRPSDRALTTSPAFVWQAPDGCTFVILKSGEREYRCQFYDKPYQQMGTGISHYDGLAECAVAILQAQADDMAERRGDLPPKGR